MKGLKIIDIEDSGTAVEIGLAPGDEIISINGQEVPDGLCYRYLITAEDVTLLVRKDHGGLIEIELEKDEDDDLGVTFPPMRVHRCNNRCVFCFVSQMPGGLRKSLYVKDEDYRHSFLYGNYITLTTLKNEDYYRILRERLSPLYVSVHTTDDAVRRFLLGNPKAPAIMDCLRRLTGGGITLHTQAVVSPGLNDGALLTRTVEDLAALRPRVASLAVVPVGLTKYRENLYPLKPFNKKGAAALLDGLEPYRKRFRKESGSAFVYPSDEFYIKAGRGFPPARQYDGYPQLDNGVGLVRDFMDEFKKAKKRLRGRKASSFFLLKERSKENMPKRLLAGIGRRSPKILLITGVSFAPYLRETAKEIESITGLSVKVLPVKNELFGQGVTVAGLLAGRDIADALKGERADVALVPTIAIREGHGVFLDDLTPEDVERMSGMKILMVEPTARGLVEALEPSF